MHLFVIYIGGSHSQSLIELHDMRFMVANTIEETYEALRQSWWGIPTSLHLDAWGILHHVDGHNILVSEKPPQNKTANKLYFVNLGGYDKHQFTELHENLFVVARDEDEAKKRAVQQINQRESPHRDYLHEVDTLLDLSSLLTEHHHYVHLVETEDKRPFEFTCRYTPIGKLQSSHRVG
jgi:hypothetical protein